MMVLIRKAVKDDARAITGLLDQLGYPGTETFISPRVSQQIGHPDALLLVAEMDAQLVGFISLHFIPQLGLAGAFCRVSYFCVSESKRDLGIGAKLAERAEAEARTRGCDRMEVHCHARRVAAHRFYRRQGYRESPKYLIKMLNESNPSFKPALDCSAQSECQVKGRRRED
jgi:GNAT superfamily N-acetyltransferase